MTWSFVDILLLLKNFNVFKKLALPNFVNGTTLYCPLVFRYDSLIIDPFVIPSPINHSLGGIDMTIMIELIYATFPHLVGNSYHGNSLGALGQFSWVERLEKI